MPKPNARYSWPSNFDPAASPPRIMAAIREGRNARGVDPPNANAKARYRTINSEATITASKAFCVSSLEIVGPTSEWLVSV